MALTLLQMRARVALLLKDRQFVHYSAAELNDWINEANRELYEMVAELNIDFLPVTETQYTWAALLPVIDLATTAIAASDFRLLLVRKTPRVEAISTTNLPVPLDRINYEELYRHPWTDGSLGLHPDEDLTWGGLYELPRWAMQGTQLFLDPVPTTAVQLDLIYLTAPAPVTLDAEKPVTDRLLQFEPLVTYGAALKAIGKDRFGSDQWAQEMGSYYARLQRFLDRWSQDGTPRVTLYGR